MISFIKNMLSSLVLMRIISIGCIIVISVMYYIPDKYIKITVTSPLYSNNAYIDKFIIESEIDYIGVFEYEFAIDGLNSTVQKSCSYKKDFCIRQDNNIVKYELSSHIQNECYYIRNFHNIGSYASCPIIVRSKLRGYAIVGSSDIMVQSEIEYYARSIAESIAQNTQF